MNILEYAMEYHRKAIALRVILAEIHADRRDDERALANAVLSLGDLIKSHGGVQSGAAS